MAVSKDSLAFVIILAIIIAATGVAIFYCQSRKYQKRAAALNNNRHIYDVEMIQNQVVMSPERKPQTTLWRCKSDAGPQAKQSFVNRASLPRSHSAGAMAGLARPSMAFVPRWSRPARRLRLVVPLALAKAEEGYSLEKKAARKSRFIEHL
ncbi:hypothetical protein MCOR25_009663 [Pyricularia grisea]|nr:hypothetical protein MCOR25_009663 [Pyricularia grisea]